MADEIKWITLDNGVHIPIKPGQTKDDAVKSFTKSKNRINAFKRLSLEDLKRYCLRNSKNNTLHLDDIDVGKSVGAKALNYEVMDLTTGEVFNFAPGTKLQNVEVFCGNGTKKTYKNAYKYADSLGGAPEEWQHAKAIGYIETTKGNVKVEVHWSQHHKYGKHDFFIKRYLE